MDVQDVPGVLQGRLGVGATAALVAVFNQERVMARNEVLNLATERFERRLVEEASKLRVEMAQGFASQLRWMFLFWVSQLGAFAALLAFVRR